MSKKEFKWTMKDGDTAHVVTYVCRGLSKNITMTVDGTAFELKTGLFKSAARNEIFRVGDDAYTLVVDKAGNPQVLFGGEAVEPDKQ